MLASSYQPFELLVVDDRSTDDTAAIVERLAADDPRAPAGARRAAAGRLVREAVGLRPGRRAARGELLLFTDADTRHEPELLGRAVGALRARAGRPA